MQLGRHAKLVATPDGLQRARQVTLVLVLLTAGLSVSSVRYLGQVVASRRVVEHATRTAHAGWHDVLNLVEHNLESHLPHQVADELAAIGVGQRPQGVQPVYDV